MLFTSHLEANKAKRHTHLGDGGLRTSIPFALLLLVYFLSFSLTLFHSYVQIVFYGWGGVHGWGVLHGWVYQTFVFSLLLLDDPW